MAEKRTVGRPPKYKSKEEIEEKIEAYFENCKGELLRDKDGDPVIDRWGTPIIINAHPPTVTGLALALGFLSRQGLLEYQAKPEFSDTITRAKARVEEYTEQRLFDRDGTNGAQFSLRNNFKGWREEAKSEQDEEEQRVRIEQVKAQLERTKAQTEQVKIQTELLKAKAQDDESEAMDDGFIEALNASAGKDWSDEE